MDERMKLVGPELDDAFTCWFNADDVDLGNMDDVMHRADCVAAMMLQSGLAKEQIAASLHEVLEHWGPEVILEFNDAGNVAWDFDETFEGVLKSVLRRVASFVERDGVASKTASPERHASENTC